MALPRRDLSATPRVDSPGVVTWLPLAGILIGMASLFHLALTSELTTTGYSIQELQVEESDWKLRNEQLALDVARARSLAVVEEEATRRLKMVRPKDTVYLEPSNGVLASRSSPSSRGEARGAPELEKPEPTSRKDALQVLQQAVSGVLAPRPQTPQR